MNKEFNFDDAGKNLFFLIPPNDPNLTDAQITAVTATVRDYVNTFNNQDTGNMAVAVPVGWSVVRAEHPVDVDTQTSGAGDDIFPDGFVLDGDPEPSDDHKESDRSIFDVSDLNQYYRERAEQFLTMLRAAQQTGLEVNFGFSAST